DRAQVLEIELLSDDLEPPVDEDLLARVEMHGEITAGLDRIEDPAPKPEFLQRRDRADGKYGRRFAVAEADRIAIQRVEAGRDREQPDDTHAHRGQRAEERNDSEVEE